MSILLAGGAAAGQAQSDAENTTVFVTNHNLSGSGGTFGLILEANGELKTYHTLGSTTSHTDEWGRPIKPAIGGYFRTELFLLSGDAPSQGDTSTEVLIDGSASAWGWKAPVSGSVVASCSVHIKDQEGLFIDSFDLDVNITA